MGSFEETGSGTWLIAEKTSVVVLNACVKSLVPLASPVLPSRRTAAPRRTPTSKSDQCPGRNRYPLLLNAIRPAACQRNSHAKSAATASQWNKPIPAVALSIRPRSMPTIKDCRLWFAGRPRRTAHRTSLRSRISGPQISVKQLDATASARFPPSSPARCGAIRAISPLNGSAAG